VVFPGVRVRWTRKKRVTERKKDCRGETAGGLVVSPLGVSVLPVSFWVLPPPSYFFYFFYGLQQFLFLFAKLSFDSS